MRTATILGEAISIAALTRKASADLQSRSDVSSRAMARAGGTVVTASGRLDDACVARRLRVAHSVTTRRLPPYPASRKRRHSSAPAVSVGVQPLRPSVERGLARSEHVGASPGQETADGLSRDAGRSDDLFSDASWCLRSACWHCRKLGFPLRRISEIRGSRGQSSEQMKRTKKCAKMKKPALTIIKMAQINHLTPVVPNIGESRAAAKAIAQSFAQMSMARRTFKLCIFAVW
ncbi:MAG: hypothetical protein ACRYGP_32850 [Janthinobacterium lividum]